MTKQIVVKIVVGGLVINRKNEILILQRNKNEEIYPNLWELPSGKKEPLEPIECALKREVREECGLDVMIDYHISIFEYQIENDLEIRDCVQINYLVRPKAGETVYLSDEHQNFAWINESNLNQYKTSDSAREAIHKAFVVARVK